MDTSFADKSGRAVLAKLLADAFDTPGEQSTNVGWANRLGEILTSRPQYDESTRYTTASPLVNISEGDIGRATEAAMAASGGGLSTKGIKAYHSSPHDFDKFDLAKIGTGEGAQVYGHGLYFAENPAVSGQGGQYWNQFKRRFGGDEAAAMNRLWASNFNRDAAIETTQRVLANAAHPERMVDQQRVLELLKSGKPVGPRTYEVNINADPAHMLDWDKTFTSQSEAIQEALLRSGIRPETPGPMGTKTISDLPVGPMAQRQLRDPASLLNRNLTKADIPGIRYLDEGSRGHAADIAMAEKAASQATNPTTLKFWQDRLVELGQTPVSNNYVIRDPSRIRIDKKYVLPTAGAGAGALAARDREE